MVNFKCACFFLIKEIKGNTFGVTRFFGRNGKCGIEVWIL